MRNLQREYQDLEMKGAQEQDHLLFELGRLGEELLEKNKVLSNFPFINISNQAHHTTYGT